eukprot:7275997-Prorocentrum_lima.AAC.1
MEQRPVSLTLAPHSQRRVLAPKHVWRRDIMTSCDRHISILEHKLWKKALNFDAQQLLTMT